MLAKWVSQLIPGIGRCITEFPLRSKHLPSPPCPSLYNPFFPFLEKRVQWEQLQESMDNSINQNWRLDVTEIYCVQYWPYGEAISGPGTNRNKRFVFFFCWRLIKIGDRRRVSNALVLKRYEVIHVLGLTGCESLVSEKGSCI